MNTQIVAYTKPIQKEEFNKTPAQTTCDLFEPPAIIRYSKARRIGEISNETVQNLSSIFEKMTVGVLKTQ